LAKGASTGWSIAYVRGANPAVYAKRKIRLLPGLPKRRIETSTTVSPTFVELASLIPG
jgi:hypothetical protein